MDVWMYVWIDVLMNVWMRGWKNWMYCMNWMYISNILDEWMNGSMEGRKIEGCPMSVNFPFTNVTQRVVTRRKNV